VSALASILLAVTFLAEPDETVDVGAAAAISADADRVALRGEEPAQLLKAARITSRTSDFDRKDGVVMFEGGVVVRYSDAYTMSSDRLYLFLAGSNELHRVVAVGNVAITNASRVGNCAMATFRRKRSEIEMFGDEANPTARLVDSGKDAGALEGARIKFWLDTEQVEVERSRISVRTGTGKGKIL